MPIIRMIKRKINLFELVNSIVLYLYEYNLLFVLCDVWLKYGKV